MGKDHRTIGCRSFYRSRGRILGYASCRSPHLIPKGPEQAPGSSPSARTIVQAAATQGLRPRPPLRGDRTRPGRRGPRATKKELISSHAIRDPASLSQKTCRDTLIRRSCTSIYPPREPRIRGQSQGGWKSAGVRRGMGRIGEQG